MAYQKCLAILIFIITSAFCNNTVPKTRVELKDGHVTNATENMATIVATTAYEPINLQVITPILNGTANISSTVKTDLQGKRRVLIINSPLGLRQNSKVDAVRNLMYVEYSDDGAVILQYMMNNMEDVSRFFQTFLHTHVCRGSC